MNVLVQLFIKVLLPLILALRAMPSGRMRPVPAPGPGSGPGSDWVPVRGIVTGGRLDDDDTGSVTRWCPVLEVSWQAAGRSWVGTVAAPRHICVDHAAARRLLAGPFAPGRPIDLLHHVDDPSRVKIA